MKKLNLLLFLFAIAVFACSNNDENEAPNNGGSSSSSQTQEIPYYLDSLLYNGITYSVVQIGNQAWLGENLNAMPSSGNSWCYGNMPEYCNERKHGRLYDWDAASRVCPNGWRLPSIVDFDNLYDYVKQKFEHVGSALKSNKSTDGWNKDNGPGNNNYLFAALPSGYRSYDEFYGLGSETCWWSSTESGGGSMHIRCITGLPLWSRDAPKTHGLSVRCIRN
jgi:uncharacterized protein (TIGR02145 family)